MSTSSLKLIAIITMLIDHVGAIFYPNVIIFRMIGRLAFPIFAFLIAQGYFYTKNIKKYLLRLTIFAFISEIPYDLAFSSKNVMVDFQQQNVIFTLLIGLFSIIIYEYLKDKNKFLAFVSVFTLSLIAFFLKTDYYMFGVLSVFSCYYFKDNMKDLSFYIIYLNGLLFLAIWAGDNYRSNPLNFVQLLAPLSLIFIKYFNGKKGYSLKYFFYLFYPLHLLTLYFLYVMN